MRSRAKIPVVRGRLIQQPTKRGRPVLTPAQYPGRWVIVKLTTNHNLGGKGYGIREVDTEVRVREGIARTLMESEQRVQENRRRFLEPRDHVIGVAYNNRTVSLAIRPGHFDEALADIMKGHGPVAPAAQLHPSASDIYEDARIRESWNSLERR